MSLEAAFAIGRAGNGKTTRTCRRCKGTGWWQLGRKCFACGGAGRAEIVTAATHIRDKRTHIGQVEELLADEVARLDPPRRPFAQRETERRVAEYAAQLETLRADLAALEAQP